MSSENDELDDAFGADEPQKPEASGDEIDAAFAEQPKQSDAPPLSVGGYPTWAGMKGAADVAVSMARAAVNKPTASLVGGASWLVNPTSETYRKAQQEARESIDRGEGIVQPEGVRTPEGAQVAENIQKAMGAVGGAAQYTGVPQALDYIKGKIGPEMSDFLGSATEVLSFGLGRLFGLKDIKIPRLSRQSVEMESAQSMGAAKASVDFSNASPELRAAFEKIPPKELDPIVAQNHLKADSLPVKMRLTEGQATGNPDIITDEMNTRGATKLSEDYNLQGKQLKENLQAIRDEAGPDVFSTNHVDHGQSLIDSYKAKDAPIVADIKAKYQALEDANGGALPIDGKAVADSAKAMLRKKLKSNYLPSGVSSDLERFANGEPMTFEDFEAMRTNLAAEIRKAKRSGDGNAAAASGIVREALENFPLQGGAEQLKPLADSARSAAKARFDALKADPAYEAAVEDEVASDHFVKKFVAGNTATRDNVARMRANLINDPAALQTMSVAALDDLREAAGIDRAGNGKFGQARFNKRLEQLDPKAASLFPPQTAEHLRNLGDVARLIKEQPEGSAVNNSGTLSGAIAQFGGQVAQGALNVKTGGLAGPIIEHIKGRMSDKALAARRARATEPLAGARRMPSPSGAPPAKNQP